MNSASTYDALRTTVEEGGHAAVHSQSGGDCGDMTTMYSTNDPLFFLHHTMIDKIWWRWGTQCAAFGALYGGPGANRNDVMVPFRIPVSQVLSTTQGGLCYSYGPSEGDLPLALRCTAATGSSSANRTSSNRAPTPSPSTTRAPNPVNRREVEPIGQGIDEPVVNMPLPTYTPSESCKNLAPKVLNFCDQEHTRHPPYLDESWLKMMNMDVRQVRAYEVWARHQIDGTFD
jgi:Common central domain of tyrosinase